MTEGRPSGYRPVLWWTLGGLAGGVLGFGAGAAAYGLVFDRMFSGGLESLGPALMTLFAALLAGVIGGAATGGTVLLRWHRRQIERRT